MMSCHISLGEDIAYHLCFSQILHTNSIKVAFGYSPWENKMFQKIEKHANWKFIEIKSDRFLSNFDIQYYYFELFQIWVARSQPRTCATAGGFLLGIGGAARGYDPFVGAAIGDLVISEICKFRFRSCWFVHPYRTWTFAALLNTVLKFAT